MSGSVRSNIFIQQQQQQQQPPPPPNRGNRQQPQPQAPTSKAPSLQSINNQNYNNNVNNNHNYNQQQQQQQQNYNYNQSYNQNNNQYVSSPPQSSSPYYQDNSSSGSYNDNNYVVSLEKQYHQLSIDGANEPTTVPVSLHKPSYTSNTTATTTTIPYQQHQQKKDNNNIILNKINDQSHSRIALASIGVSAVGGANVLAHLPETLLCDRNYISTIQYTEVILEIREASIKPLQYGEKFKPIFEKTPLVIYKTIVEDVVIIQIGNIDKDSTPQEDLDKLEVLLMYYTTYYRLPIKKTYTDDTAKKMESASGGLEKGSLVVSKGLVSGGQYFAKGASKIGDLYKNNSKKYEGPEMTEEQRRALEDPNHESNKSVRDAEKFASGTSSVKKGIVGAFGFAGSKISQGVRSTDWYKEREEKKKQEESEDKGKSEKKSAAGGVGSAGLSAFKNVWGGLEEGVLISARGVRDASVDAKRHTNGDYEAEISKRKWNSAGNLTVSVVNVVSIVSTTWIKGALYAAAGAISYDPDVVQHLSGAWWRAGWLAYRSDLLSGVGWTPRWVVLRNSTIAIYSSPRDPPGKPLMHSYLTKVKGIKKLKPDRIQRDHGFEVVTTSKSLYFSTYTPEVDYSHEPKYQQIDYAQELSYWVDSLLNVQTFVGTLLDDESK
ncbi:hypothetical protein DFA_04916 [Cavenderia fasciculata]|uniref:PH domain-containing protein n=1 Tax=Cavenderia fasciculata TaxID=261658 RepID=F4PMD6_CACFS|nr:uncharacterized protein DFA_04916 [Cavenderia fasciculata]EGG22786.1 hypothetical protein DFA_04916 [Cavenderia fasciculata]|eukprot:XP_004360637.1 hypothetical protein DFA_04916 [Cavenderia fasciculata]